MTRMQKAGFSGRCGTPPMSSVVPTPRRSGSPYAAAGGDHFGSARAAALHSADPVACVHAGGVEAAAIVTAVTAAARRSLRNVRKGYAAVAGTTIRHN